MQMPKPTDADKQFFRSLVPEAPGVEVKPMFGTLVFHRRTGSPVGQQGAGVRRDAAAEAQEEIAVIRGGDTPRRESLCDQRASGDVR